jgi:hypothetical protein
MEWEKKVTLNGKGPNFLIKRPDEWI